MSLITCQECLKQYSDQAKACIHCGHKIKKPIQAKLYLLILVLIIFIFYLFGQKPTDVKLKISPLDLATAKCKNQINSDLNNPNYITYRVLSVDEKIQNIKFMLELEVIAGNDNVDNMKLHFFCTTYRTFNRWDTNAVRLDH